MANFNETVLMSSQYGESATVRPTGTLSSFDYLKILYAPSAVLHSTSKPHAPMYVTYMAPSATSLELYGNFLNSATTTTASGQCRAAAKWYNTNTNTWATSTSSSYNRTGLSNQSTIVANSQQTRIFAIIGVTTGSAGDYHKDILYNRDTDGASVVLKKHPSAYERIGISTNLEYSAISSVNRSIETYSEYLYNPFLSRSTGYQLLVQHPFYTSTQYPPIGAKTANFPRYMGYALYGASGTAWNRLWSMNFNEKDQTGVGGTSAESHVITRVIGINRK